MEMALFIFIALAFVLLFLYLVQPANIKLVRLARSLHPNFDRAMDCYPVPKNIDKQSIYSKNFKSCILKDDTSRLPGGYEFKLTQKGVLIRELMPSTCFMQPKIIFVPLSSLKKSMKIEAPRCVNWYWYSRKRDVLAIEIMDSSMILFVKKKDWNRQVNETVSGTFFERDGEND